MAQIQWRSDDTSKWGQGFGNGSGGVETVSADSTDNPTDSACTGSSGALTLAATNSSFAAGQIILIHQSSGLASGASYWQLNYIVSYSAGTIVLLYPLINDFVSGAQVMVVKQVSKFTVNSAKTLTAKAWNGTVGGLLARFSTGPINITGNIVGDSCGFSGGVGTGLGAGAHQGDSSSGAGAVNTGGTNGGAGGGAGAGHGSANDAGGGGGSNGGGGATNGTADSQGDAGTAGGGNGSSSDLITMLIGAGGGGGHGKNNIGTDGGKGSAIILLVAPSIVVTGTVTSRGGASNTASGTAGSGGAGAGGPILLKGRVITLGNNLVLATGGAAGGSFFSGGNGSAGRVHADYSTSLSGATNPSIDSRQDQSYNQGFFGGML